MSGFESERERGRKFPGRDQGEGMVKVVAGEETTHPRTSMKRRRSGRSSDGDEEDDDDQLPDRRDDEADGIMTPARPELGNLHKRRASASPEKFNKGRFEPLPLRPSDGDGPPVAKKAKLEKKLGTPIVASFPANNNAAQHARPALHASLLAAFTAPLLPSSSTKLSPDSASTITTHLLNASLTSPPPKEQEPKAFSLVTALCRDNDLLLLMISYLNLPSLLSLYSISKTFHYLFNRHHTAFVLSCMRTWAPGSDTVYPWRCYKSLCVKDPGRQRKAKWQGAEQEAAVERLRAKRGGFEELRDVPSLRWLQMVVWREGVCRDMLIQLATKGLRCPVGTLDAIKRMWFVMDLPLNTHRIALMRNEQYLTVEQLLNWTNFLLKIDMHFTDPAAAAQPANHPNQRRHPEKWAGGNPSGVPLRKMLLEQRHLTPLWRVLRGWNWDPTQPAVPMTRLDILRLWVRHRFSLPDEASAEAKRMNIMSIPWYEVGTAGYERTGVAIHNLTAEDGTSLGKKITITDPKIVSGKDLTAHQQEQLLYPHNRSIILAHEKPREKLFRPDELLLRECVRRKLSVHTRWVMMMLWGFCDEVGWNLPVFNEEEWLRMLKGLNPKPELAKRVRKVEERDDGSNGQRREGGSAGTGNGEPQISSASTEPAA